ncbi:uncharacterized protein B0H18DRAFT_1020299 [Fomitopsis serialis]|uniref:uncharacterized protein n=1 Tax=Fomitopsis serialis TaxID=139415 RepID=UPI0020073004|nr:uncharacterized protein B0H18DRAFT_1020299 [Neoantrodia serialis]KAH9921809.1 hypothetical protein B0H18DRAFT_1020299 [Neoantrodia serialis]
MSSIPQTPSSLRPADDPRDASAEVALTFPESWQTDSVDGFSATTLFATGLIMVTRNRYLAWPALVLSFNSMINQHPLRTKDGGTSPITSVLVAFSALVTAYLPLVTVGPQRVP